MINLVSSYFLIVKTFVGSPLTVILFWFNTLINSCAAKSGGSGIAPFIENSLTPAGIVPRSAALY